MNEDIGNSNSSFKLVQRLHLTVVSKYDIRVFIAVLQSTFHSHMFMYMFLFTEWSNCEPEYDLSNENKTATRTNEGATYVLYSSGNSYVAGGSVTFRFMDAGESSPLDGVGLAVDNQDAGTLQRENAVFLTTRGLLIINLVSFKSSFDILKIMHLI